DELARSAVGLAGRGTPAPECHCLPYGLRGCHAECPALLRRRRHRSHASPAPPRELHALQGLRSPVMSRVARFSLAMLVVATAAAPAAAQGALSNQGFGYPLGQLSSGALG